MKQIHKTRKSSATDTKILENTRRWRLTYKGLTANLYAKIRERSKRNDRQNDQFNLGQFRTWFKTNGGYGLWIRWRRHSYERMERPSVDRIDCLDGYRFPNMQVISAQANRLKGDKEKMVLWGKPVHQISLSGMVLAKYPNIHTAMQITGINRNNISSVLHGKRKSAGGFRWEIIGNIYENPELLDKSKEV